MSWNPAGFEGALFDRALVLLVLLLLSRLRNLDNWRPSDPLRGDSEGVCGAGDCERGPSGDERIVGVGGKDLSTLPLSVIGRFVTVEDGALVNWVAWEIRDSVVEVDSEGSCE